MWFLPSEQALRPAEVPVRAGSYADLAISASGVRARTRCATTPAPLQTTGARSAPVCTPACRQQAIARGLAAAAIAKRRVRSSANSTSRLRLNRLAHSHERKRHAARGVDDVL